MFLFEIRRDKVACNTEGCERPTWNGDAGRTCCRTCGNPELAAKSKRKHGLDCEAKFMDPSVKNSHSLHEGKGFGLAKSRTPGYIEHKVARLDTCEISMRHTDEQLQKHKALVAGIRKRLHMLGQYDTAFKRVLMHACLRINRRFTPTDYVQIKELSGGLTINGRCAALQQRDFIAKVLELCTERGDVVFCEKENIWGASVIKADADFVTIDSAEGIYELSIGHKLIDGIHPQMDALQYSVRKRSATDTPCAHESGTARSYQAMPTEGVGLRYLPLTAHYGSQSAQQQPCDTFTGSNYRDLSCFNMDALQELTSKNHGSKHSPQLLTLDAIKSDRSSACYFQTAVEGVKPQVALPAMGEISTASDTHLLIESPHHKQQDGLRTGDLKIRDSA